MKRKRKDPNLRKYKYGFAEWMESLFELCFFIFLCFIFYILMRALPGGDG